ncbi:MAG: hypothetical protein ACREMA_20300, partial [Longimicrobiales bacterium]
MFIERSGCRRVARTCAATIALAGLAACGETGINELLTAARVESVASGALSGQAGQMLPNPVEVRVFGSDDEPLPGANVTFSAGNGGSVDPASATT